MCSYTVEVWASDVLMPMVISNVLRQAIRSKANVKDTTVYRMPRMNLRRLVLTLDFHSQNYWWAYRKKLELIPEITDYDYEAL